MKYGFKNMSKSKKGSLFFYGKNLSPVIVLKEHIIDSRIKFSKNLNKIKPKYYYVIFPNSSIDIIPEEAMIKKEDAHIKK